MTSSDRQHGRRRLQQQGWGLRGTLRTAPRCRKMGLLGLTTPRLLERSSLHVGLCIQLKGLRHCGTDDAVDATMNNEHGICGEQVVGWHRAEDGSHGHRLAPADGRACAWGARAEGQGAGRCGDDDQRRHLVTARLVDVVTIVHMTGAELTRLQPRRKRVVIREAGDSGPGPRVTRGGRRGQRSGRWHSAWRQRDDGTMTTFVMLTTSTGNDGMDGAGHEPEAVPTNCSISPGGGTGVDWRGSNTGGSSVRWVVGYPTGRRRR